MVQTLFLTTYLQEQLSKPNYGIDIAHLKEYSQASDSFDDYYKKFINISNNEYLDAVGGMSHVNSISKTIF